MRTSVVIVSYRPHGWLERSVASAVSQADEVIVVDNGSQDGAVGALAAAAGARIVSLPTNTGFAEGVNQGVHASTGDVVALLNDDAMADPGWLASATAILDGDDVAAVAPKMVFALPHLEIVFADEPWQAPGDSRRLGRQLHRATVGGTDVLAQLVGPGLHRLETGDSGQWRWTSGAEPFYLPLREGWDPATVLINDEPAPATRITTLINNAGSYLTLDGYAGDYGSATSDDGQFDQPADRFAACGGALVTTRRVLDRIGRLPPEFFLYYEDVDWCWRAQLAGLRIRYEPAGVVRHVGGVSTGGLHAPGINARYARNRILCLCRNAPLRVAREQLWGELRVPAAGLRRQALAATAPRALAQRGLLRRGWRASPGDVWKRWAGVDVRWPVLSAP